MNVKKPRLRLIAVMGLAIMMKLVPLVRLTVAPAPRVEEPPVVEAERCRKQEVEFWARRLADYISLNTFNMEPIIILLMAVGVGFVVIAILLPILGLSAIVK